VLEEMPDPELAAAGIVLQLRKIARDRLLDGRDQAPVPGDADGQTGENLGDGVELYLPVARAEELFPERGSALVNEQRVALLLLRPRKQAVQGGTVNRGSEARAAKPGSRTFMRAKLWRRSSPGAREGTGISRLWPNVCGPA